MDGRTGASRLRTESGLQADSQPGTVLFGGPSRCWKPVSKPESKIRQLPPRQPFQCVIDMCSAQSDASPGARVFSFRVSPSPGHPWGGATRATMTGHVSVLDFMASLTGTLEWPPTGLAICVLRPTEASARCVEDPSMSQGAVNRRRKDDHGTWPRRPRRRPAGWCDRHRSDRGASAAHRPAGPAPSGRRSWLGSRRVWCAGR